MLNSLTQSLTEGPQSLLELYTTLLLQNRNNPEALKELNETARPFISQRASPSWYVTIPAHNVIQVRNIFHPCRSGRLSPCGGRLGITTYCWGARGMCLSNRNDT